MTQVAPGSSKAILAFAIALSLFVGLSFVSTASASKSVKTFAPIAKTRQALVFKINDVSPRTVRSGFAELRYRGKIRRAKIPTRKVRRAAKGGALIVSRKPRKARRAKARVARARVVRRRAMRRVLRRSTRRWARSNGKGWGKGGKVKVVTDEPTDDGGATGDGGSTGGDGGGSTQPPATGCTPQLGSLVAPGCDVLFNDTAQVTDPSSIWGSIDCQESSRQQVVGGGDSHATSQGAAQGDTAARRMTVLDGDDFWGERCELGRNDHGFNDPPGPTVLYHEGERRVTFTSIRLPDSFPLDQNAWQVVMQMKQTQPSANGGGTPVLALHAYNGRWRLEQSDSVEYSSSTHEIWSAPAQKGTWTRFALDIRYSQDPNVGSVSVYVDLNGDGDASDAGEQSPAIRTYTLKRETDGGSADGIAPGESIPSHLRSGMYHKTELSCPAPTGCAVDVDNVQVVNPD